MSRKPIIASLAMSLLLGLAGSAVADSWRTVTSGWDVERVIEADGMIWAGTGGGLLRVNPATEQMTFYNADAGLTGLQISELAWDSLHSRLWIGYEDAQLNVFDVEVGEVVTIINDLSDNQEVMSLNDLVVQDSTVWVLTNVGLSSLSYVQGMTDRWVVEQTYRQFGSWTTAVSLDEVAILGNKLFIGSSEGIAYITLDGELYNPDAWTLLGWEDGFSSTADDAESVSMLKVAGDRLYATTSFGLYRWDGTSFPLFGEIVANDVDFLPPDSIAVARWNGINVFDTTGTVGGKAGWPENLQVNGLTVYEGAIWAGMNSSDLVHGGVTIRTPTQVDLLVPNTPGGNSINALKVDQNGDVWMTSTQDGMAGLFRYTDGNWISYSRVEYPDARLYSYGSYAPIAFDNAGEVWFGSYGLGLGILTLDEINGDTLINYSNANSPLVSHTGDDDWNLVLGLLRDPAGGMWFTNSLAYNYNCLYYVTPEWIAQDPQERDSDEWISYGPLDGLTAKYLGPMVMDPRGRIWFSYPRVEDDNQPDLVVLDPAGTPEDSGDDDWTVFGESEFDFSYASDLAIDEEGILWLATPEGLYYIDTNVDLNLVDAVSMTMPVSNYATAVEIDPINQVWVGTDLGVVVLSRDRYSWVRKYTPEDGSYPSPLVSELITDIAIEFSNGDVWLGTGSGASVVSTPFRNFADTPGTISVAPQPFFVGADTNGPLLFSSESLAAGATIRVHTPSGHLLRTLDFEAAALDGWDGQDESGEWVASGVYLLVVTGSDGTSQTGKAAVIRR